MTEEWGFGDVEITSTVVEAEEEAPDQRFLNILTRLWRMKHPTSGIDWYTDSVRHETQVLVAIPTREVGEWLVTSQNLSQEFLVSAAPTASASALIQKLAQQLATKGVRSSFENLPHSMQFSYDRGPWVPPRNAPSVLRGCLRQIAHDVEVSDGASQ